MSDPLPLSAPRQRVSASSIKELTQCSLSYYYNRVLKMPQKEWPRTVIGSLCHAIFESLANPRHRRHYDIITGDKTSVDYTRSVAVNRLVLRWKERHRISDELLADLNGMLYVGLVLIDFHFTYADQVWPPEHEFNLVLNDGTQIRGFIDRLAEKDGVMIIRDYKSQRNRFTAKEMANSIQAYIYQLYCWKAFGKAAKVEFVLLRHPPTKRTSDKHLQVVSPSSPSQLSGLEEYIKDISRTVNNFTLEQAYTSTCSDHGFCTRVCSYYAPLQYWALIKKDDSTQSPLKTFPLDKPPLTWDTTTEALLKVNHPGCAVRYSPSLSAPPS